MGEAPFQFLHKNNSAKNWGIIVPRWGIIVQKINQ
jgi:hypothetical protein